LLRRCKGSNDRRDSTKLDYFPTRLFHESCNKQILYYIPSVKRNKKINTLQQYFRKYVYMFTFWKHFILSSEVISLVSSCYNYQSFTCIFPQYIWTNVIKAHKLCYLKKNFRFFPESKQKFAGVTCRKVKINRSNAGACFNILF
jgi:hypothetical protein